MAENFGITQIGTIDAYKPLFYNDHPAVDRPVMIADGQQVSRGDILYFDKSGRASTDPVAGEANVGNGEFIFNDLDQTAVAETITATYDGAGWDISGSTSGAILADQASDADIAVAGVGTFRFDTGEVAWANGDAFSFEISKSGVLLARKATTYSHLIPVWGTGAGDGVGIAGKDTDASDEATPSFAYVSGVFNQAAIGNWATLVASAGDVEEVVSALQERGIHVREEVK